MFEKWKIKSFRCWDTCGRRQELGVFLSILGKVRRWEEACFPPTFNSRNSCHLRWFLEGGSSSQMSSGNVLSSLWRLSCTPGHWRLCRNKACLTLSPASLKCTWPQIPISESTHEKSRLGQWPVWASTVVPLVQAGLPIYCSASLDWGKQEEIAGVRHVEICCLKLGYYLYKSCHRNLGQRLNFTGPMYVWLYKWMGQSHIYLK